MRIFLAGHKGMVGSAIARQLAGEDVELVTRESSELDLKRQSDVDAFLLEEKPDQVILAAARVGGILANQSFPAEFIYENLMIECNVIDAAYRAGVTRLLNLGSSCIYPKHAPQPIPESALLTGLLEPTNEPYAIAKIAGLKLCESYNRQYGTDYRSVMPTNLYGAGDNFHPETSHVVPALIRRFHEAVERGLERVIIWGSGAPRREFLHVDDMATGALFVAGLPKPLYEAETSPMQSYVNLGTGQDISIAELASIIADITGFTGEISYDPSKPDGAPRKLLDVTRLNRLGWQAQTSLKSGLASTYAWYLANIEFLRG